MKALYIGSTAGNSGKSMITMGLGLHLREQGRKVGYLKPVGRSPVAQQGRLTDGDAEFMKHVLGLDDPLDDICPVVVTHDLLTQGLRGDLPDFLPRIQEAFGRVGQGKDVVLVGGAGSVTEGMFLGLAGLRLVKALNLPVVLIDPYQTEVCVDCILSAREALGERLLGVVLNRVTPASLAEVVGAAVPFLQRRGIPVLGTIPHDLLLDAITVRQLHGVLGGRVLCAEDRLDEFVERFSVGAMDVEAAFSYFWKQPNKAVITGGHRSDILMAALETSTRCLVLTGDQAPNDLIVTRAVERGIPILVVPHDTLATVERLEAILGRIRIREERKVARACQLIDSHLDYAALDARWTAFAARRAA
jgi:hypothetical protein